MRRGAYLGHEQDLMQQPQQVDRSLGQEQGSSQRQMQKHASSYDVDETKMNRKQR